MGKNCFLGLLIKLSLLDRSENKFLWSSEKEIKYWNEKYEEERRRRWRQHFLPSLFETQNEELISAWKEKEEEERADHFLPEKPASHLKHFVFKMEKVFDAIRPVLHDDAILISIWIIWWFYCSQVWRDGRKFWKRERLLEKVLPSQLFAHFPHHFSHTLGSRRW